MDHRHVIGSLVCLLACGGQEATPQTQAAVTPSAVATVTIATPSATPTASAAPIASATVAASSTDAPDAGNMWGDPIGDSFGAGGLGLSGTGEGAGGGGEGIGLGNIGTGQRGSTGAGMGQGFGGNGHGPTAVPTIRQGQISVNGRLPPEVILRIVRQNYGRFRLCYEEGLRGTPSLQGRVAVKFVIDRAGAVIKAEREVSTDLPSASVVSCITRGFSNLSFPQPEGGIVTVVYPLIFAHP